MGTNNRVGDAVDAAAILTGLLLGCAEGRADFWARLDHVIDAVGLAAVACERSAAALRREGDWNEAEVLQTVGGRIRAVMAAILIHLVSEADGPCPILESAVRAGFAEAASMSAPVDVA